MNAHVEPCAGIRRAANLDLFTQYDSSRPRDGSDPAGEWRRNEGDAQVAGPGELLGGESPSGNDDLFELRISPPDRGQVEQCIAEREDFTSADRIRDPARVGRRDALGGEHGARA